MRIPEAIRVLAASALMLPACSIKEDRTECPCYLDVTLLRQAEDIFPQDKAWCSIWADGIENVGEHVFEPVIGSDGTLSCAVRKNPSTAVAVTNLKPESQIIAVPAGGQMERLYASRLDVECLADETGVEIGFFGKQYVNVSFRLNDDAIPFREDLTITLDGPYDGLTLPSMTAHPGAFSCSSRFDEKGEAALRIPPQGGPGLKACIRLGTNPPAAMDLYRVMLDADFDWETGNLGDFEIEIGMNNVTGIAEILDWEIVTLEGKKF